MDDIDEATLAFYRDNAADYAARWQPAGTARLDAFLARLPERARILELGCGGGRDSEVMLGRGFDLLPSDGVPEMAREAERRLGRAVAVLRFEELAAISAFDGVWANASLLHVPRAALGGVLARIFRALRPGGVFYASYKAGRGEGRDSLGRHYNYPTSAWLRKTYATEKWGRVTIEAAQGGGYDGRATTWLHVTAVKTD